MQRIGFFELLVILIVALVIFGPSKLPEVGKSLGKAINEFKVNLSGDVSGDNKKSTKNVEDKDESDEQKKS